MRMILILLLNQLIQLISNTGSYIWQKYLKAMMNMIVKIPWIQWELARMGILKKVAGVFCTDIWKLVHIKQAFRSENTYTQIDLIKAGWEWVVISLVVLWLLVDFYGSAINFTDKVRFKKIGHLSFLMNGTQLTKHLVETT